MADVYIPDPIVLNILVRLPAKPLSRFRCLITDPSFMASRRRIFLTIKNLHIIDHNETPHSILKISYPFENLKGIKARVIGTFKGLVLVLYDYRYRQSPDGIMILCNPFTEECTMLPHPPENRCCRLAYGHQYCHRTAYAYGFGYGENLDDLKIVRFKENNELCRYDNRRGVCQVFSFKRMTWSMSQNINIKDIKFEEIMGTFVNGYLYWLPKKDNMLIVLDVKEMVVSELRLPFQRPYNFHHSTRLGLIDGCLCLLNNSINETEFDLWVMNEKSIWLKRCSFTLALDLTSRGRFHYPICILNDGRILIYGIPTFNSLSTTYQMDEMIRIRESQEGQEIRMSDQHIISQVLGVSRAFYPGRGTQLSAGSSSSGSVASHTPEPLISRSTFARYVAASQLQVQQMYDNFMNNNNNTPSLRPAVLDPSHFLDADDDALNTDDDVGPSGE